MVCKPIQLSEAETFEPARSIIVSLCRSARLREARRADLARYFGAQLAPSAALQAADATLLLALEVSPICSSAEPTCSLY